jgi:hypothetical protein
MGSGKKTLMYQNERAAQESVFGELRSQSQMDYIAVRGLWGNQLYMLAEVLSHNLPLDEVSLTLGVKTSRNTLLPEMLFLGFSFSVPISSANPKIGL